MPTMLVPQKKNGEIKSASASTCAPTDSAAGPAPAAAPLTLASVVCSGIRGSAASVTEHATSLLVPTQSMLPFGDELESAASMAVSCAADSELLARETLSQALRSRANPFLRPRAHESKAAVPAWPWCVRVCSAECCLPSRQCGTGAEPFTVKHDAACCGLRVHCRAHIRAVTPMAGCG